MFKNHERCIQSAIYPRGAYFFAPVPRSTSHLSCSNAGRFMSQPTHASQHAFESALRLTRGCMAEATHIYARRRVVFVFVCFT